MYENFINNLKIFTLNSLLSLNFMSLITGLLLSYFIYYKNSTLILIFLKNLVEYTGFYQQSIFQKPIRYTCPNLFKNLSRVMWKTYDELFIDKLIVNGIANKIQHISMQIRKFKLVSFTITHL